MIRNVYRSLHMLENQRNATAECKRFTSAEVSSYIDAYNCSLDVHRTKVLDCPPSNITTRKAKLCLNCTTMTSGVAPATQRDRAFLSTN